MGKIKILLIIKRMTCFWSGILNGLPAEEFDVVFNEPKPNINAFINLLKKNNVKTDKVKWNGDALTEKQFEENHEHVNCYDVNNSRNGYLCSTCDPFLLLVCQLFQVNITHNYCGNPVKYEVENPKFVLFFSSNTGHFEFRSRSVIH